MKKKTIIGAAVLGILAIGILALGGIGIRAVMMHMQYVVPNQSYFGENYKEIFRITDLGDKAIANNLMEEIDSAFSFIGSAQEAEQKHGVLSRYSITSSPDQKLQEVHKVKLISADFAADAGYIWIEYSSETYDADSGKMQSGSWGILTRMTVEKINGEWVFTACKEHP